MTKQQLRLLRFVNDELAASGVAPSFQEIADGLGYKSKAAIHRIAYSLREDGLLNFIPGKHRNMSVTYRAKGLLRGAAA